MIQGTVIIVTYNASSVIERCLSSLMTDENCEKYKVVVVDNCSSDDTVDIITTRFQWVSLILSKDNGGFGAGRNIGLREAEGDWILILNPDVEIKPDSIKRLANYINLYSQVGCAAPAVVDATGQQIVSYFPFLNIWTSLLLALGLNKVFPLNRTDGRWEFRWRPSDRTVKVDRVLGAVMMFSRNALNEIGGFDERFFLYSEEEDICYRLSLDGWKVIYYPEAGAVHKGAESTHSIYPVAVAAANWSRYLYMKKHFNRFTAEISRWIWIKMISIRFIFAILRSVVKKDDDRMKGYWLSLKSLFKPEYFDRVLRPPRNGINEERYT